MSASARNRALGVDAPITRRDFPDGALLTLGSLSFGASLDDVGIGAPYPPAWQGAAIDFPVSMGTYHFAEDGRQPVLLTLV